MGAFGYLRVAHVPWDLTISIPNGIIILVRCATRTHFLYVAYTYRYV